MKFLFVFLALWTQLVAYKEEYLAAIGACDYAHQTSLEKINECFVKTTRDIMTKTAGPDGPVMGLELPEPLSLGSFPFVQNTGSLNVQAEFNDVQFYGFSNVSVVDATTKFDDRTFTIDYLLKDSQMEGNYVMNGNVILLPIHGKGPFFVNAKNVLAKIKAKVTLNKDNPKFLGVGDLVVVISIGAVDMHFLHLFEDDPILDETMHHFLNTNHELIIHEILPILNTKIGAFMELALNTVYAQIPTDLVYPYGY